MNFVLILIGIVFVGAAGDDPAMMYVGAICIVLGICWKGFVRAFKDRGVYGLRFGADKMARQILKNLRQLDYSSGLYVSAYAVSCAGAVYRFADYGRAGLNRSGMEQFAKWLGSNLAGSKYDYHVRPDYKEYLHRGTIQPYVDIDGNLGFTGGNDVSQTCIGYKIYFAQKQKPSLNFNLNKKKLKKW